VKVACILDVKIRIYCPESLEQFYQKPIPLWHFFSPINQWGEIYQWTVVRDRWAEGWEGQQRFFTGPPHQSSSPTFSPLWIGLLLTGWAFNLFNTLEKKIFGHLDFAHKIMYWLLKHCCTRFLAHIYITQTLEKWFLWDGSSTMLLIIWTHSILAAKMWRIRGVT